MIERPTKLLVLFNHKFLSVQGKSPPRLDSWFQRGNLWQLNHLRIFDAFLPVFRNQFNKKTLKTILVALLPKLGAFLLGNVGFSSPLQPHSFDMPLIKDNTFFKTCRARTISKNSLSFRLI